MKIKMNPKDYRAVGIKNSSILIVPNKNFDIVFNLLKEKENIVEIPVTQKMLDNFQILSPYKLIGISNTPNFDYIKQIK